MFSSLDGIRVLDLTLQLPGPYASQLLLEHGADVLKVEPPTGDPVRGFPSLFAAVNRGKRSIALDLKDDGDRARFLELAEGADVVLEGFRPGVARRLGVDEPTVRECNRAVVYCSISGYGQSGPQATTPGHDLNYQALAGVLAPDGRAAVPTLPIGDLAAGLYAAFEICAGLRQREQSGDGVYLDVSMTDLLLTWTFPRLAHLQDGEPDFLVDTPHYGLFVTSCGRVIAIGVVHEEHFWQRLCDVLDLSDALRSSTYTERLSNPTPVRVAIEAAVRRHRREDIVRLLTEVDVPVSPVLSAMEAVEHQNFADSPAMRPDGHGFRLAPVRSSGRNDRRDPDEVPALGQHGDETTW